jgi:hypothetical protein
MERRKVLLSAPRYPTRRILSGSWGPRLLLLGALCVAPLPACDTVTHVDGLMAAPEEEWDLALPLEGSRTMSYDDGAVLEYRLLLQVNDPELADWLEAHAAPLLDEVEALLREEGSEEISVDEQNDLLGLGIAGLLMNAYQDSPEAAGGHILECALLVLAFESPEGIDDTG